MGVRLLVCGDREWKDPEPIRELLLEVKPEVLIEGECRGADLIARAEAEKLGILVLPFPAQWKRYGRAAGALRNQQMLDEGKPTMVVGFHDRIGESRGTRDMLRRARKKGLLVEWWSHKR